MIKKFIFICLMCCITACCREKPDNNRVYQINELFSMNPKHFVYENHKYIQFGGSQYYNDVVHDPNCPCTKTF